MCGFVQVSISLAIVRSNTLLLWGPRDKEVSIWQHPELMDRTVMSLLLLWRGYRIGEC